VTVVHAYVGHERCWTGETRSAVDDRDDRAVLVHFAITELVEPRPREEGVAARSFGRDGHVEGLTVDHASSHDGLDDVP